MVVVGVLGAGVGEGLLTSLCGNVPILSLLISALGMSLILENSVLATPGWGSPFLVYPFTSSPAGFSVSKRQHHLHAGADTGGVSRA